MAAYVGIRGMLEEELGVEAEGARGVRVAGGGGCMSCVCCVCI